MKVFSPQLIRFGLFEVDTRSGELRRQGSKVNLQEQPFQVLVLLLERHGEVVTRAEFNKRLWPENTFVDFERGLNKAINKLRGALRDDADRPCFIETLPQHGYRFIAPLEGGLPALAPDSADQSGPAANRKTTGLTVEESDAQVPAPGGTRTQWRRVWLAFLVCVSLVGLFVGFRGGGLRRFGGSADPGAIRSLAVLPLENLSHDSEQEYFADGMAEALTTELAQISALQVISHTSVVQYKGTKKSLPQIAQELGVDAVVEGAVQRSGDKVGITVQLINAPSDRHLWAKSYERDLHDVLGLQRDVAHAIADEIKAKLTPPEMTRFGRARSVDSEAYENYLRGRFLLTSQGEGDARKGMAYFQRAIQKDPNYALAYAGLAESYITLSQPWNGALSPQEALPQAKKAATKALEIDDSLGEAQLALARVSLYDWDWPDAEKEYRRALELNPNDAMAHGWYGEYLQAMARNEEAIVQLRQATTLDPLSSNHVAHLGSAFYHVRQYDQGIREFQKALQLEPDMIYAHQGLGWVYEQKKMYREAIAEQEKAVNLTNRDAFAVASLGRVLGDSGKKREARKLLEELQERSKHHDRYMSPCVIAIVQIGLGERDQAIASLEQGYTNRDQCMLYLKVDPHMDDVRSDSRFQDLLRRVGLPQ